MKMKIRSYVFIFLFFLCSFVLHAGGQTEELSIPENSPSVFKVIDSESRILVGEIIKEMSKFSSSGNMPFLQVSEFVFKDERLSGLGTLWKQNLQLFLGSGKQQEFMLTASPEIPDFVVCGEIARMETDIHVYTQIVNRADFSIIESWINRFPRNDMNIELLNTIKSSSRVLSLMDAYEPDERENPVPYEAGSGWIKRNFHNPDDVDWFIINVNKKGLLTLETKVEYDTDTDTLMRLYKAGSTQEIDMSDDIGSYDKSSRIDHYAAAGENYIVSVKGYGDYMGVYSFRAVLKNEEQ